MQEQGIYGSRQAEERGYQIDLRVDQHAALTNTFSKTMEMFKHQYDFRSVHDVACHLLFQTLSVPVFNGKDVEDKAVLWLPSTTVLKGVPGPRSHYEVVVIGKMPGTEELYQHRMFCGPSGQLLLDVAYEVGIGDHIAQAYGMNVVRFYPPDGGKTLKPQYKRDCEWLLMQDIATVKPSLILCLGTDAVKAVYGKRYVMSKVRSHLFVLKNAYELGKGTIRDANLVDELDYEMGIKVFATVHPAAVLREEGLRPGFRADLLKLREYFGGKAGNVVPGKACDYRYITDPKVLAETVDEVLNNGCRLISVDCEWGGGDFMSGKLRTIQFSWKERSAACIIYRREGLRDAVNPAAMHQFDLELKRLIEHEGMRVVGHNVRADALWLSSKGINVMGRVHMDTMLVDHILYENAEHNLESCAVRYTDMGRYDWSLRAWLSANRIGDKQLHVEGYKRVPDDLLHPYSCCDADATLRVCKVFETLLQQEHNKYAAWCYWNVVHPCMTPLHEMEINGVLVDRERLETLVHRYEQKKLELVESLRDELKRPDFNFRSPPQVQRLLFGKKGDGGLELTPLKTTEKPARMWEDILFLSPEETANVSASTDGESLEYLSSDSSVAAKIRDIRIIDQVTKNFLRPAVIDEDTGYEEYMDGLVGEIDPDGRIRTSFNQMSETGRQKSSHPNCQNLPKKQNGELDRIMGPGVHHIRSAFISPTGCVLVEADYQSAELFTLGFLSNCSSLIKDCKSDLHARGAVTRMGAPKWDGFDQHLKPDKKWKEKYGHIRVASKTISFGIPYQRGAKAIAREIIKSTKGQVTCDISRAQQMVDGFYEEYPEVKVYVDMCKESVFRRSLHNPYGRTRRFAETDEQSLVAAMQREAVNFPIQSTVADTLNTAMYNTWYYRIMYPGMTEYKLLLAVHDALFLEVPVQHVDTVVSRVLPLCMRDGAVIPPWQPTPEYVVTQPFTLDIDIEIMTRWGEKAKREELLELGLSEALVNKHTS